MIIASMISGLGGQQAFSRKRFPLILRILSKNVRAGLPD